MYFAFTDGCFGISIRDRVAVTWLFGLRFVVLVLRIVGLNEELFNDFSSSTYMLLGLFGFVYWEFLRCLGVLDLVQTF